MISRRCLGLSVASRRLLSTTVLAVALVTTDFSLAYVADTTSISTPWPFRLAALWGGMDGSMLFYAALTLLVGRLGIRSTRHGKGRRRGGRPGQLVWVTC